VELGSISAAAERFGGKEVCDSLKAGGWHEEESGVHFVLLQRCVVVS